MTPTYTMKVVVSDRQGESKVGKQQFWNSITNETGCDRALKTVKKVLSDAGIDAEVFFEKFEHV